MGNKHSFEKEKAERPQHEWHIALDNAGMAMCTASLAALLSQSVHTDHYSLAKKSSELCLSDKCPHPDCDIPEEKKNKKKKEETEQEKKT